MADDDIAAANRRHWQRMVDEGCGFTRPWLSLSPALVRRLAQGELHPVPEPLTEMYPQSVLAGAAGHEFRGLVHDRATRNGAGGEALTGPRSPAPPSSSARVTFYVFRPYGAANPAYPAARPPVGPCSSGASPG